MLILELVLLFLFLTKEVKIAIAGRHPYLHKSKEYKRELDRVLEKYPDKEDLAQSSEYTKAISNSLSLGPILILLVILEIAYIAYTFKWILSSILIIKISALILLTFSLISIVWKKESKWFTRLDSGTCSACLLVIGYTLLM